jgi:phosphoglucomutase
MDSRVQGKAAGVVGCVKYLNEGGSQLKAHNDWNQCRAQVERRFHGLSSNATLVECAMTSLEDWLSIPVFAAQRDAVLEHVNHGQISLLLDSFYQLVPFGTGGRRGRVGYGPNRINEITVAMSVQGHCNFLRQALPPGNSQKIVVAFDTRVFSDIAKTYSFLGSDTSLLGLTSRALARIASEIYAANGFLVHIAGVNSANEYLSTPELSFAIRHLGALAGMNVSASHNHPDDNGFKFFNEHGGQDVPPTDQTMAEFMGDVKEIRHVSFATALSEGRILPLPSDLHEAYIVTNLALRSSSPGPVTVVYTPLCGTGDRTVGDVLRAAGHDVRVYEPHNNYDGTFANIPLRLPNPEVPEAASPALSLAKELDTDIVLCTDPDADRLGVFARDSSRQWRYLNGNEIACVLAYYLTVDRVFGPKRSGVLIKTLVTTRMLERIGTISNCSVVGDLLVGFKYIANVLLCLDRDGSYEGIQAQSRDLVLAAEESHGVLLTPKIRDKDAAGGAVVLCELLAHLHSRGQSLPEYLDALALECGNYRNVARGIMMRGIRGSELLAGMMSSLRENPPVKFGGMPVIRTRDLLSAAHGPILSETERLSRNFMVFELEAARIVVRPSGTEPKAKIYVDVEGSKLPGVPTRKTAARFASSLAANVLADCIARVGFHLSDSAKLLPDYIDLDLKALFDTGFRHELLTAADNLGHQSRPEQLAWLRDHLAPYGAGSDPLAATAPAVVHLLAELRTKVGNPGVADALQGLAESVAESPAQVEWAVS